MTKNEQARRARAAWMGDDLLVYATASDGRSDWYRLDGDRALNLTARLTTPPRELAALGASSLQIVSDGALWDIDRDGHARRLRDVGAAQPTTPPQPLHARASANPVPWRSGAVLRTEQRLARSDEAGVANMDLPAGCSARAIELSAVAALCEGPGGRREVQIADWTGRWRTVLTMNAAQSDVEPARMERITPTGAPFSSWLYLPSTPPPRSGYPLVVIPYRGAVYPKPDPRFAVGAFVAYLNPQILAAAGYAVLLPSLPFDEATGEPAANVAKDILQVVDASLAGHPLDAERIGLWGHSFGAMNAVAAASQSPRFRTVIAVSGMHDIVSRWGMIPTHRWVVPEDNASIGPSGTVEGAQSRMGAPPWVDPDRYQRNSNLFLSDKITAPVLLIHGETDELRPEQSQELFTALFRQGKDAAFVTYWGEGHALASPANIRDYYARVLAWLAETLPTSGVSPTLAARAASRADQ